MLHESIGQAEEAARLGFKTGMRHLVGAVSVITASVGSERNGLTATSVTSLSAEPPSLIVCVKRSASGLSLIRQANRFGVNVLGSGQTSIADRFAGRSGCKGAERFVEGVWTRDSNRPPMLTDALVSFDCDLDEVIERFSHAILVGRVLGTYASLQEHALTYWRGEYGSVGRTIRT